MQGTATPQKIKRRRPIMLARWSATLIASARRRALHLHSGRPRLEWECSDGYVELRVTVRGAVCVDCDRRLQKGEQAIYAYSGDIGRTPYPRYLHLEPCTAVRAQPLEVVAVPAAPASPVSLAQLGLYRPESLTPQEVRAVCELALATARKERAS